MKNKLLLALVLGMVQMPAQGFFKYCGSLPRIQVTERMPGFFAGGLFGVGVYHAFGGPQNVNRTGLNTLFAGAVGAAFGCSLTDIKAVSFVGGLGALLLVARRSNISPVSEVEQLTARFENNKKPLAQVDDGFSHQLTKAEIDQNRVALEELERKKVQEESDARFAQSLAQQPKHDSGTPNIWFTPPGAVQPSGPQSVGGDQVPESNSPATVRAKRLERFEKK